MNKPRPAISEVLGDPSCRSTIVLMQAADLPVLDVFLDRNERRAQPEGTSHEFLSQFVAPDKLAQTPSVWRWLSMARTGAVSDRSPCRIKL